MRKGEKRSAVMRPAVMPPPNFIEESGRNYTLPHKSSLPRKPRFEKGSQETKNYMASIRNNKQGSGFFKNIGKSIKKRGKQNQNRISWKTHW